MILLLAVIALAVRIAVPSGWMPSAERGFALTVCVGGDMQIVWLDKKGSLHEREPGQSIEKSDCAFAGSAPAMDLPTVAAASEKAVATQLTASIPQIRVSIGHGLAAPPPPATGPPSFI